MVPPELAESLPPEMSDTTLVVHANPDAAGACSGGELGVLEVNIDRVVGDVERLKQSSQIAESAAVQIWLRDPADDVRIEFNGHVVAGQMSERDGAWGLAHFQVPIEYINFPEQPRLGEERVAARNTIEVLSGTKAETGFSCAAYGGAVVIVYPVPLPVLLFHKLEPFGGPGDFDAIWVGDPTNPNDQGQLGANGVPFLYPVLVPSNPAPLQALVVAGQVALAKTTFGVQRVTLVGHSQSGRAIRHYAETNNDVANVMTLGAPHGGSRLFNLLTISMILRVKLPVLAPFYGITPAPSLWTVFDMTTWWAKVYNWLHGQNPTVNYETVGSVFSYNLPCPNPLPPNDICPLFTSWEKIVGKGDIVVSKASSHALPWTHTKHNYNSTYPADIQAMHLAQNASQKAFNKLIGTIVSTIRAGNRPELEFDDNESTTTTTTTTTTTNEPMEPVDLPDGDTGTTPDDEWHFGLTTVFDMEAAFSTVSQDVPVEKAGEVTFLVFHGDADLAVVAHEPGPGGRVLTKGYAMVNNDVDYATAQTGGSGTGIVFGYMTTIRLDSGAAGNYVLDFTAGASPSGVDVVAMIKNPAVTLSVTVGAGADSDHGGSPSDSFDVFAEVSGGIQPGASLVLNLVKPDMSVHSVTLFDNGGIPDATANDGIYSGTVAGSETLLEGDYAGFVEMDATVAGKRVTRQKGVAFKVQVGL